MNDQHQKLNVKTPRERFIDTILILDDQLIGIETDATGRFRTSLSSVRFTGQHDAVWTFLYRFLNSWI